MAVDLKNINILLDEFQRISSGWYNAGEVKLHDSNTPMTIEQPQVIEQLQ